MTLLTPYDDFPIHPGCEPLAHTVSGDPNHYDRYFFNGHHRSGEFFIGAAMGHYPVRGVIDAAFSVVRDGVQHSVFGSGRMPLDRSTVVGPFRIEVVRPMQTIRFIVEPNEHGIEADLTFEATTVAVEEPRQRKVGADGILFTDHTRITQWGTWRGTVAVDGDELQLSPADISGTRDRSWGVRPVGPQAPTNRPFEMPQVFWLWAPLHFGDRFTHLGLHEHSDGDRWFETALVLDPLPPGEVPWSRAGVRECRDIRYEIEWEPGRREMKRASLDFLDPVEGEVHIELEKFFTFRMSGIGYNHPEWAHGTAHGELATARESIKLRDFEPTDIRSLHIQSYVRATMGDRVGVGILEQVLINEHEPTGLTGVLDGYQP